ncbi:MAG: hypothetical protein AB8G05_22480 [Oligoflexales bacterium]
MASDEKNPDQEDSSQQEESGNSIDQIEQLQLPKRMEKRRRIYLGEQILCWIGFDALEAKVDVIDISTRGIALVETREKVKFPPVVGQKIVLSFGRGLEEGFKINGAISNIAKVSIRGVQYDRIGIQFQIKPCNSLAEFNRFIGEKLFACQSYIRPQACYQDPFFYNEMVLFQVNSFSATGADLLVSARCKTLLPKQPLELDFYFPGRGRFMVKVNNSDLHFRTEDNRYRIFVYFDKPDKKFLEMVSEYLVMFADEAYPNALRENGFTVGDLSLAFDQNYSPVSDNVHEKEQLEAISLAPPIVDSSGKSELTDTNSRTISCKLGPHFVATMELVFCDKQGEQSALVKATHKISSKILNHKHIELTDLHVSSKVNLVDFLLPLLTNCVRIGVQSQSKFILLECAVQVKNILEKLGFNYENSQRKRDDSRGNEQVLFLMSLDIKAVLLNRDRILADSLWKQVYRDLFEFFKKQHQKTKKSAIEK